MTVIKMPSMFIKREAARLPDALHEDETIANMPFNEKRYVTPWTMQVDLDARCWINVLATTRETPGGTVQMGVIRTYEGLTVYPPRGYRWTPLAQLGEGVIGSKSYQPVVRVVVPGEDDDDA